VQNQFQFPLHAFPASSLLKWKGNIGGQSVLARIPAYRLWSHELYCFVLHCWVVCIHQNWSERHSTA
jgi:hypothetical protein